MGDKVNIPAKHFYKLFADSTGGTNMNPAASSKSTGQVAFSIVPATSIGPVEIHRVNFTLEAPSIFVDGFGGGGALTNGIEIKLTTSSGGEVLDFLDGTRIQKTHHFSLLSGVDVVTAAGTSANAQASLPIRWTLDRSGVPLTVGIGHELRVTFLDDVSSSETITEFMAQAQGHY